MFSFTEEEFVSTVIDLIIANPDFIYVKPNDVACYYVPMEDSPACLFGQALKILGVSDEDLDNWGPENSGDTIKDILEDNTNFSPKIIEWAHTIQRYQDVNRTWKTVLINATLHWRFLV